MSRYPYIDRHPCITAAGKPIGDPCANVKSLLQDVRLEDKVEAIRKELGYVDVKDYGSEWMKGPDQDTSGAFTEIRHCLRPPLPTPFQALDEEIKCTFYDSYWNKPVGQTRDQTPGLPAGMNPTEVTFGKPGDHTNGGQVINPPKKASEVEEEEKLYHDLYAFSHQNHYPGEQIKQWWVFELPGNHYKPPFNEHNIYGRSSNKDESGARVKQSLTWFNNDTICNVSRRQANIRNRTLPAVGKGLDKTGVTDLFPEDHTYGKPNTLDFYGVEDLLNECPPSLMRRDMLTFLSYVNGLRQAIYKKIDAGDLSLEELYEEILGLSDDPEGSNCMIHFDCIDKIMKRRRIYIDRSKLEPLLLILGKLSQDNRIKVRDFISIIDKNSRFPDLKQQYYILPPEFQTCGDKKESADQKDDYRILMMPPAGVPTVRLDKAEPIYRDSIVNMDNLSEETTARTLISPSIYTQYGVSHRDFFQPRSKEFLGKLFRKIDVTISDEELDEIYKEGYELDKTGGVCVETFRNILDERAYNAYSRIN